ncbi:MAG: stage II sporulation protein R [Oscillospiraceae bacterium]|nr:stage II sporulation protein R [Oscillospiraceae bacterium]
MCTWKRWEKALALALLLTLLIAARECRIGMKQQHDLSEKMVRLHVLANSDSENDQRRKLLVKDAVFVRTEEILRSAENRKDAEHRLQNALPELESLAEETLRQDGRAEEVYVTLANERFRTRYYDDFTLPAGQYRSLQVVIGEGNGQNWWCVVFPPLCSASADSFSLAAEQADLNEEEMQLIRAGEKEYLIRFRTVELWNRFIESLGEMGSGA